MIKSRCNLILRISGAPDCIFFMQGQGVKGKQVQILYDLVTVRVESFGVALMAQSLVKTGKTAVRC